MRRGAKERTKPAKKDKVKKKQVSRTQMCRTVPRSLKGGGGDGRLPGGRKPIGKPTREKASFTWKWGTLKRAPKLVHRPIGVNPS